MEVPPAEPFQVGQVTKDGMQLKVKISLACCEALDQGEQLREILFKIHWTRASIPILIDFWWCLDSLWPLQRGSKRNPFDHSLLEQVGCEARAFRQWRRGMHHSGDRPFDAETCDPIVECCHVGWF